MSDLSTWAEKIGRFMVGGPLPRPDQFASPATVDSFSRLTTLIRTMTNQRRGTANSGKPAGRRYAAPKRILAAGFHAAGGRKTRSSSP